MSTQEKIPDVGLKKIEQITAPPVSSTIQTHKIITLPNGANPDG